MEVTGGPIQCSPRRIGRGFPAKVGTPEWPRCIKKLGVLALNPKSFRF